MAFGAVVSIFSFVKIFVARHAICFFGFQQILKYRKRVVGFGMTGKTVDVPVASLQLKSGSIVVKRAFTNKGIERTFGMALVTAASLELVVMGVLMAVVAIVESDASKLLKFFAVSGGHFMAFLTIDRGVFSFECKIGKVVVEFGNGGKPIHIVATQTVIAQGFLVEIIVAGKALGV